MHWFLVFVGCGLGGVTRYALSLAFQHTDRQGFPWSTFLANTAGCLLIGILLGILSKNPSRGLYCLCVTGFCGGFTTFSTFSNEALQLLRQGNTAVAVTYVVLSLVVGLGCVAAGFAVAK